MERRSPNIQEVASRAGVSISTVSRVLNETGYPIRPETRQRVLEAIDALGFHPSPFARALLGKPTETIGLMIPDISNPYYPLLSKGVEDVANELGYTVIFCNTDRSADKARRYLQVLREKRVDGIIFAGGGHEMDGDADLLGEIRAKVVLIGRHLWPFPSVQVDNTRAAYEATVHLIGLGHRRVGFISGPLNLTSALDRLKGYKMAMEEAGAGVEEPLLREGDFHYESGYQAALSLLKGGELPTAIFASNDRMAMGAVAAAYDLGMRVPEELAVVGFDDTPSSSYVRPSLTSVSLPSYEMGATAARLLSRQMIGEPTENVVWVPSRLVVRQSSGGPVNR